MASVVSIRDWEKHFECAQSRKVTGPLAWFSMPTKHDGKSFRRLMAHTDGPMIYAAWVLMCAVAAKATVRGRLADADGPLSAADLELKTGFKATNFETAIKVLSSKEIGWLLFEEWEDAGSEVALQDTTGQDKTEQVDSSATAEPPVLTFETVGEAAEWHLTQSRIDGLREAFPTLDVLGECRKARQWCSDNRRNRKTPIGMPKFLFGWMSREQNSLRGSIGAATPQPEYRQVSRHLFDTHAASGDFKDGPERGKPDENGYYRIRGTLKTGRKIESHTAPNWSPT